VAVITLNVSRVFTFGSSPNPTTYVRQNLYSNDTIQLTVTYSSNAGAGWSIFSNTNCTSTIVSAPTNSRTGTFIITPSAAGNYQAQFRMNYQPGIFVYATIGGVVVSSSFDADPDDFSFASAVDNTGLGLRIDSEPMVVSGITASGAPVYSQNCALFKQVAGSSIWQYITTSPVGSLTALSTTTVNNGDSLKIGVTASVITGNSTTGSLTVFNTTRSFTVLTDITLSVDDFTFSPVLDANIFTLTYSNYVTISGLPQNTYVKARVTAAPGETFALGYLQLQNSTQLVSSLNVTNGTVFRAVQYSSTTSVTESIMYVTVATTTKTFSVTTTSGDQTPDEVIFTPQTNVPFNTYIESNEVTITGISIPISVNIRSLSLFTLEYLYFTNNQWSNSWINGSNSIINNVVAGDKFKLRIYSGASLGDSFTARFTYGTLQTTFNVSTPAIDDTPDNPFGYDIIYNAEADTLYVSPQPIKITGINVSIGVNSTGEYSFNGVDWTTGRTYPVGENTLVYARVKSSPSLGGVGTQVILEIGSRTTSFTVYTKVLDYTPDPYTLGGPRDSVPLNSIQTSDVATITGINIPADLTFTGWGGYRKRTPPNAWPADYVTTDTTVQNGDEVQVQLQAASTFSALRRATLSIGFVSRNFDVTTEAKDTTPDAFSFGNDRIDVARSSIQTSEIATISGMNTTSTLTFSGSGGYRRRIPPNAWPTSYTTVNAIVQNGDEIEIQFQASPSFGTLTSGTVTIGGVSASFNATTIQEDKIPDPFGFGIRPSVVRSSIQTSDVATITGINSTSNLTFTGFGGYRKRTPPNAWPATYGTGATTVQNGDQVEVQLQASSTFNELREGIVTIEGVSGKFSVTTEVEDTSPDQFYFTDIPQALTSLVYESNEITITGINSTATVTFSGTGEFRRQRDGTWGTYGTGNSTAISGDKFQIRLTSASTTGTTLTGTLNVGGVQDSYIVTTSGSAQDSTPNQFSFTARDNTELNTRYISNEIVISGVNVVTPISIVDGEYELNLTDEWTTTPSTVANGTKIRVRRFSANSSGATVSTTLTVGTVEGTFSITTKNIAPEGDYGFEVYNSLGVKTVTATTRTARLVASGSTSVTVQPAAGTYYSANIPVTGITNDDSWVVLIYEDSSIQSDVGFSTERGTNFFRVVAKKDYATSGTASSTFYLGYYILRN
jgi:hypothetical protein